MINELIGSHELYIMYKIRKGKPWLAFMTLTFTIYFKSKRSRFITLVQAAIKSVTIFGIQSWIA